MQNWIYTTDFYYLSSHNDPTPLKCFGESSIFLGNNRVIDRSLVYLLFLAEWIQTAFLSVASFAFFVGTDSSLALDVATVLFQAAIPILSALIAAMVQIFYAWRIWIITARKLLILALIITLVRFVTSVLFCPLLHAHLHATCVDQLALSQLAAAIVSAMNITGSTPVRLPHL